MIEALKKLYRRDLDKLRLEIESYPNEDSLWIIDKDISNSAGNLCLHLIGNLSAYIGVGLANLDYTRNRPFEFSLKDVPKSELIKKIDEVTAVVEKGLNYLTDDQLRENFPILIWNEPSEMEFTLIHLYGHLSYHLGQINYHRRLIALGS